MAERAAIQAAAVDAEQAEAEASKAVNAAIWALDDIVRAADSTRAELLKAKKEAGEAPNNATKVFLSLSERRALQLDYEITRISDELHNLMGRLREAIRVAEEARTAEVATRGTGAAGGRRKSRRSKQSKRSTRKSRRRC